MDQQKPLTWYRDLRMPFYITKHYWPRIDPKCTAPCCRYQLCGTLRLKHSAGKNHARSTYGSTASVKMRIPSFCGFLGDYCSADPPDIGHVGSLAVGEDMHGS